MASTVQKLQRLKRRADTLHRKAEDLMAEAMNAFGPDWTTNGRTDGDNLTDFADNIVVATEDAASVIDLAISIAKRQHKDNS